MSQRAGIIGLFAIPALVLGGCAPDSAQDMDDVEAEAAEAPPTQRPTTTAFGEWDINQDQALQRDEFNSWSSDEGVFDDWIGDAGFDREAFGEAVRNAWDVDGDDRITEPEWQAGTQAVYSGVEYGTFADWDANGDAELDLSEMTAAEERVGLVAQIDASQDGAVDEQEVGDFLFGVFDANDDGQLDTMEWETGRATWLDDGMGM